MNCCQENTDENMDTLIEFGTYNGHVKWPYDYEMSFDDILRYENYNKAKDLIGSGIGYNRGLNTFDKIIKVDL